MTRPSVRPVPLTPQRRFAGARFGAYRSPRRGEGDEVAGTRPYRRGDRISRIDWAASARLSAARGTDEFVTREFFADQAPRVVVVCDRRPAMAVYGGGLPWLDKAAAAAGVFELVASSVIAERADLAYADQLAELVAGDRPLDTAWRRRREPVDAQLGEVGAEAATHELVDVHARIEPDHVEPSERLRGPPDLGAGREGVVTSGRQQNLPRIGNRDEPRRAG